MRVYEIVAVASGGDSTTVIMAMARGENHLFRVELADGRRLVFKNFLEDLCRLGETIQRATLPYLLPAAFDAIQANRSLVYGPLTINSQGISTGKDQTTSWADLEKVNVENGWLKLHKQGRKKPWLAVRINEIPNMHVLLSLIERCRR